MGTAIGSVSLIYPFGRDQGIYAYVAKLILNGKIDYKYSYNLRPPATHYVFALSQFILGESMMSMRLFDLVWQLMTAGVLFYLAYKMTKSKVISTFSSLLYIFLYYRLDYWHTLQTDSFMNLPFICSILFLLIAYERKSLLMIFLSGFFFALTFYFKFTVILFLPLLVGLFLFTKYFSGMKRKTIAYFFGGVEAVVVPVWCYYFFNGAISQFNDILFSQIPLYAGIEYQTESFGFVMANILRLFTFSVYSPLILFSVLAYAYLFRKKMMTFGSMLVLFWTIASLLCLIIQWKFYLYHFIVIVPPLAVGTAMFFSIVMEKFYFRFPKVIPSAMTAVIVVYVLISAKPYVSSYKDLLSFLEGKTTLEDNYVKKGVTSDSVYSVKKTFEAADFIKNNSETHNRIYIWGIEPLIYYLSGRDCASRFTYNTPLYWKGDNEKYREEFISEINTIQPALVLVAKRDRMFNITGYDKTSEQMLLEFPEFKSILDSKYKYIKEVAEFEFYKLESQQN